MKQLSSGCGGCGNQKNGGAESSGSCCGSGGGCASGGCGGGCASGGSGGSGGTRGGSGGCCGTRGQCPHRTLVLTEGERDFLELLAQSPFLPLARLVRKRPGEEPEAVLAPLYLDTAEDSAEAVREKGDILLALEAKRLVTLDYDKMLSNGDYTVFEKSAVCRAALLTAGRAERTRPELEYGSIALTSFGQAALDSLEAIR